MQRATVSLSDEEFAALERMAVAEGQTVPQLVRRAVDRLLAEQSAGEGAWRAQLDRLVGNVRNRIPPGLSSEEIENDVMIARSEVRQAHHARRHRQ